MFDFNVRVNTEVYECALGLIGGILQATAFSSDPDGTWKGDMSWYDCTWHEYVPLQPVVAIPLFLDNFDREFVYSPWTCNDYSELETEEDLFEEESRDTQDETGFVDFSDHEDHDWTFDPAQVVTQ